MQMSMGLIEINRLDYIRGNDSVIVEDLGDTIHLNRSSTGMPSSLQFTSQSDGL